MKIEKFNYGSQVIEFDLRDGNNMMVNATEMAKIFGKDVPDFMILKNTKDFISECLKNQNSGFLGIEKEEDLVVSTQKTGTWMHRVLALKFAAWLNSAFELWVYMTIDKLVFGFAIEFKESIRETVKLQKQQDEITNKLAKESPEFMEYLSIQQKLNDSKNRRRNGTKMIFQEAQEMQDLFNQKNQ